MEKGTYFEFQSHNGLVCAGYYLGLEGENSFNYVRDNLIVWNATLSHLELANEITEEEYYNRVRLNANRSGQVGISNLGIKEALKVYDRDISTSIDEVMKAIQDHELVFSKADVLKLLNWVSKEYTPDNGIDYWLPSFDNASISITSEAVFEIYKKKYDGNIK